MNLEWEQLVFTGFEAALNCDPAERARVLDAFCKGNDELRAEIVRLLAHDNEEATIKAEVLPSGWAGHEDYAIKRPLDSDRAGLVYLAENRLMKRDVVLKVMGREVVGRRPRLERFLREIRAVADLDHPNIVKAHHAAKLGANIVLVMEYVDGIDLSRLVQTEGPLDVATSCDYIRQAAVGLQHAHERGIVHRDVKPSNLMRSRERDRNVIKVLDFGVAKLNGEVPEDWTLTRKGQLLGTADYIAPEQILDAAKVDVRADVYSLGCTLYYLLTGAPPFQETNLYELLGAHKKRIPTALNIVRPDVPVELARLAAKMMAKNPRRRFQTPGEVAEALIEFSPKNEKTRRRKGSLEVSPHVEAQEGKGPSRRRCRHLDFRLYRHRLRLSFPSGNGRETASNCYQEVDDPHSRGRVRHGKRLRPSRRR